MKRIVGRYKGHPIVDGDENIKTQNEIHINELCEKKTPSYNLSTGNKIRVGRLYNTPIIEGDSNLKTDSETMLDCNSSSSSVGEAGDVVLYQYSTDSLVIMNPAELDSINKDDYNPVGVVVVPGSHDVYGDGTCGVMSLKTMDYSTPVEGSTLHQSMYWGGYGTDISTLPNLDYVPYVGTGSSVGDKSSTVVGFYMYANLPSDMFSTVQCPHDTDSYYISNSTETMQVPSPYLSDESRNPAYYQTPPPSSEVNALADFDGVGNTNILVEFTTSQTGWQTADSITNLSKAGYYPAACCCARYKPDGTGTKSFLEIDVSTTKTGFWYLPACGELGYIIPKFNKINEGIQKLKDIYGDSIGVLMSNSNTNYWASTELSSNYSRLIILSSGAVSRGLRSYTVGSVRAFLRI